MSQLKCDKKYLHGVFNNEDQNPTLQNLIHIAFYAQAFHWSFFPVSIK